MKRAEETTVLITTQSVSEQLLQQRDEISQVLRELTEDVRDMQARLRCGEVDKKTDASRLLGDLRYWLKAARETEIEIEALRRKDSGIHDIYGLDLQAAELEIGCRLDRLRACCCAG